MSSVGTTVKPTSSTSALNIEMGANGEVKKLHYIPRPANKEAERKWLLEQRAGAFRIFAKLGFSDGSSGHISLRDPIDPRTFGLNPYVYTLPSSRSLIWSEWTKKETQSQVQINLSTRQVSSFIQRFIRDDRIFTRLAICIVRMEEGGVRLAGVSICSVKIPACSMMTFQCTQHLAASFSQRKKANNVLRNSLVPRTKTLSCRIMVYSLLEEQLPKERHSSLR